MIPGCPPGAGGSVSLPLLSVPRASLLHRTGKSAGYVETGHRSGGETHPVSWPCCQASPDLPVLLPEQMSQASVVPPRISLPGTTKLCPEDNSVQPVCQNLFPTTKCAQLWRTQQSRARPPGRGVPLASPRHGCLLQSKESRSMWFLHASLNNFYQPTSPGRLLPVHVVESVLPAVSVGPPPEHLLTTNASPAREDPPLPTSKLAREGERGSGVPVLE